MLKIALTGPSGSGKGYVSALLSRRGIPCLDTDRVVHDLYEREDFARKLQSVLSFEILDAKGRIDRKKLGALVYSDEKMMEKLLRTVYPEVRREILSFFEKNAVADAPAVAVDAPQLFEAGFESDFDAVLCVTAPKSLRLSRVTARDGISRAEALLRFSHQMPAREYEKRSTAVIRNNGKRDVKKDLDDILLRYGVGNGNG